MSIAEEKREYIKKCLPLALDPANQSETHQKRYELMLQDAAEGKLYKYRTFDKKRYALSSLINGTLHCSHPDTFNDPFDMKIGCKSSLLLKSQYGGQKMPNFKMVNDINKKINQACVGCLTTDPTERLMWSHYADSHRGFCIEYDFSNLINDFTPYPVVYSETRPLIEDFSPYNQKTIKEKVMLTVLTKDKAWEYENEWRVVHVPKDSADQSAVYPIDLNLRITAVYLGANISPGNKTIILDIAKKLKISVKEMIEDNEAYKLTAKDVLIF